MTADIYPNPVSATSYISFALRSSDCNVKIEVIDLLGVVVHTLYDNIKVKRMTPEIVQFDSSDLPSGIYSIVFSVDSGERIAHELIISH
ncbi:MAG: T9SS type A sorting domain-containing protein [Ignavibacteria bacterium]|nr:T9SS type A sorting domain-containing protein [Ignavibacteria bacterium]